MRKTYKIEVDCANCANKMEEVTKKTKGIKDAIVNFMTQKMTVEFEDGVDINSLINEIKDNCQKIDDSCDILI